MAISTDDGLVSPGELLLDDPDDEPASLDPGDDEPVALHDHRDAQPELERETRAESDSLAKTELKREMDGGTVAALAAQTEALNASVGLIGARESVPAPRSIESPPSGVAAPSAIPSSPLGHSGRLPQCHVSVLVLHCANTGLGVSVGPSSCV